MTTIQYITSMGAFARIEVQCVEYMRICHYAKCGIEFPTPNPSDNYCKPSHAVRASELRRILRTSVTISLRSPR